MSQCADRSLKFGKLCLSLDDYYMIIFNIVMSLLIVSVFYFKKVSEKGKNLSATLKNNFTFLGEGPLNNFYSPLSLQQKNPSTKKKVQAKSGPQSAIAQEKVINNNELKCNSCGRSVEVSYQYTMNKLNAS